MLLSESSTPFEIDFITPSYGVPVTGTVRYFFYIIGVASIIGGYSSGDSFFNEQTSVADPDP